MSKRWTWLLLAIVCAISVVPSVPERVAWAEVAVSLSEGTEYKSFFLRGDEVQTLMGDLIDPTDEGMLAKLGGASGGVITEKRHHATLKPGEKVYAVVKVLKDVRIERMRAVLETEVTQNPRGISTAAALHQNYFQVKYIDFAASGGQVAYANAYIRDTSTQDRPFMIVTPSGDKLFYFSYQSCGGSAGIRTKITYHFTTGPAIVDVCPRQMFTSCYDIDTYLRDVPELTGDPCADWAYRYSKCFEEDIRNQVKCAIIRNTEPYVNVPGNPHVDEKTIKLRIDGFSAAELDAIVAAKDVRVGAVGVTTVNGVAVQQIVNPKNGMPETWLEVKFTVNQGAHGCQTIVVGEKTLPRPVCSPIPETFLKLIADAPDMYVGQKVFVGLRVVPIPDPLTLTVTTDGKYFTYPGMDYQRFNVNACKMTYVSKTYLKVVTDTCGIASFNDNGILPGAGHSDIVYNTEPVCDPQQDVNPILLNQIWFTDFEGATGIRMQDHYDDKNGNNLQEFNEKDPNDPTHEPNGDKDIDTPEWRVDGPDADANPDRNKHALFEKNKKFLVRAYFTVADTGNLNPGDVTAWATCTIDDLALADDKHPVKLKRFETTTFWYGEFEIKKAPTSIGVLDYTWTWNVKIKDRTYDNNKSTHKIFICNKETAGYKPYDWIAWLACKWAEGKKDDPDIVNSIGTSTTKTKEVIPGIVFKYEFPRVGPGNATVKLLQYRQFPRTGGYEHFGACGEYQSFLYDLCLVHAIKITKHDILAYGAEPNFSIFRTRSETDYTIWMTDKPDRDGDKGLGWADKKLDPKATWFYPGYYVWIDHAYCEYNKKIYDASANIVMDGNWKEYMGALFTRYAKVNYFDEATQTETAWRTDKDFWLTIDTPTDGTVTVAHAIDQRPERNSDGTFKVYRFPPFK